MCQTCYYTYRYRSKAETMQSKSSKLCSIMALTSGKAGAEYDREIEKKIFDQRKMASRLSAPKQNSIDSSSNMLRSGTSLLSILILSEVASRRRRVVPSATCSSETKRSLVSTWNPTNSIPPSCAILGKAQEWRNLYNRIG